MEPRTRILLVNDDEDALFLLGRSVRRALPFAEVAQVTNGFAALRYCESHHIDAIVTDNTMPEMDGLTFTRHLRQRDPKVPILMVTSSMHLQAEAAAAGVTAYLPSARWADVGDALAKILRE